MNEPSTSFKWLSSLWAILLGVGIIALAGSILLPSTKRARVDLDELRRMRAEEEANTAAAEVATAPSTMPATNASVESAS